MPSGIVYLYQDDYDALKYMARKSGKSFSEYSRDVLLEHLRTIGESPEQKDQSWRFRSNDSR